MNHPNIVLWSNKWCWWKKKWSRNILCPEILAAPLLKTSSENQTTPQYYHHNVQYYDFVICSVVQHIILFLFTTFINLLQLTSPSIHRVFYFHTVVEWSCTNQPTSMTTNSTYLWQSVTSTPKVLFSCQSDFRKQKLSSNMADHTVNTARLQTSFTQD